jgi:hypothetical protein
MESYSVPSHEYGGVLISPLGITSIKNNRPLRFVPKIYVQKLRITKGFLSEYPLLLVLAGFVLVGLSIQPLLEVIFRVFAPGQPIVPTLGLVFLPAGLWFLVEGLRQGDYLEVHLDNGRQKFPFYQPPEPGRLLAFFENAEKLGYVVEMTYNNIDEPG